MKLFLLKKFTYSMKGTLSYNWLDIKRHLANTPMKPMKPRAKTKSKRSVMRVRRVFFISQNRKSGKRDSPELTTRTL